MILRFFLLLLFHFEYIYATNTINLSNKNSYETLHFSEYTAVKEMNEKPNAIKDNIWCKNKSDVKLNQKHQAYWVKIKVKNTQNHRKKLYLIDERRYVFSIEYYLMKNNKVSIYKKDGFYIKENTSSFNSSQRVFPLELEAYEEASILFKVQNYNMLDMPFKILSEDYLVEYFLLYSFLQGAFFIVLFVMVIYNLIIYFIVKEKVYLYYLAYVLLLIIYQGSYFGYLEIFNLPPYLILFLKILGGIGFMIFAAIFIKELFQLKQYLPRVNQAFNFVLGYLFVLMFLYIIFLELANFPLAQFLFNLISIAMPIYASILLYGLNYLAYKQLSREILFYSITWNIISFLGLLLIMMHSGFFSTNLGIDYLFEIGIFIETILFSLILAYRIKESENQRQRQELIVIQQNRLASMGEMISTIAHQWRQPLGQINGCVIGLDIDYRKKILTSDVMEKYLLEIEKTTEYMSNIIDDFMNFFNSNKKVEQFLLDDVISEAKRMSLVTSKKPIEIISNSNKILVTGYKSELLQSLLIVINNGIDAHQGTDRVKITIESKEKSKNSIEITIKDNGQGIPTDVILHVFEPYYTTKHQSQGKGLGLYILKMIIENGMGGNSSIQNSKEGVVFTISIPKVVGL